MKDIQIDFNKIKYINFFNDIDKYETEGRKYEIYNINFIS